ncbi:uncharacterized protein [Asterias amurensis]|uniref:uncharacterized protein n=1 Tax=Asterias amurensis TaxID=7602 RepID=UPI003AB3DFC0
MAKSLFVAYLLCALLMASATARPKGCRQSQQETHRRSPPNVLERLAMRGAAITSSLRNLRNLRSIRERRFNSFPVWKSLHKMQERAMDIGDLPSLSIIPRKDIHARVEKDLLDKGVREAGVWAQQPFWFSELMGAGGTRDGEEEPPHEPAGKPTEEWGGDDWDYGGQNADDDSFSAWGDFREPLTKCSDDIVGNSCTQNSDCRGCRAFHCSRSTNQCVAGEEADQHFAGFL